MARKLRVQFPGAIYHVVNRGDRHEAIFTDDSDRESFLSTLADVCAKTGWRVHAYCLMPNHFHLVVETPQANLTTGMKWFLGTYTTRFNHRHKVSGHLFAGRYKALLVGSDGGYVRTVCDYVHLNPARARLIGDDAPLRTFRWSSFAEYLQAPERRPAWLQTDRVFTEAGIADDDEDGRRIWEEGVEARRTGGSEDEFTQIRRGWCFGSEEFRQAMLDRVSGERRKHHYGAELQEAVEAKADRIVEEELRRALWTEAELLRRRKGDREKLAIALRLREETTVTLEWIANRLNMGTRQHLNHLFYWHRRAKRDGATPKKSRPRGDAKSKAESRPAGAAPVPVGRSPRVPRVPSVPPVVVESDPDATIELANPFGFDSRFD